MNTGAHLILIAIGPVQEFIAASRKFRDLWCGSMLLSELSRRVALHLHQGGCELVFPAPIDPESELAVGSSLNVANKILAVCPAGKPPQLLVQGAKQAYQKAWLEHCADARRKFPTNLRLEVDRFEKQIRDFGEFYGVWVSLKANYASSRKEAESLLAARKCLRAFNPPDWEARGVPKSSLDGIRESVFTRKPGKTHDIRIKTGEVLDAIGAVKRFGGNAPRFDSLAELAVESWCKGVETRFGKPQRDKIHHALVALAGELAEKADILTDWASILYRHEFDSVRARARNTSGILPALDRVDELLKPAYAALGEPSTYVCYLLGDGDHMGAALDHLKTPDGHQTFSRELSAFAGKAQSIVEEHAGMLIYSGGDDVMACLPLHTALACADKLRLSFAEAMTRATGGVNSPPTFSIGLAIVYHGDDLDAIRSLASLAEKTAKKDTGRNALCLIQDKRSGSQLRISGKWAEANGIGISERLEKLCRLYEKQNLSSRLGYQLRVVAQTAGSLLKWGADLKPANAAAAETLRIMGRKQTITGGLAESEIRDILSLYKDIRNLSNELIIVRQLSQARSLAEGNAQADQEVN
jgi:CRISPR-associated protein Cmr2